MRYLLDTNICVLLIRQRSQTVLQYLTRHPVTDIAVSAQSNTESKVARWIMHINPQATARVICPIHGRLYVLSVLRPPSSVLRSQLVMQFRQAQALCSAATAPEF